MDKKKGVTSGVNGCFFNSMMQDIIHNEFLYGMLKTNYVKNFGSKIREDK